MRKSILLKAGALLLALGLVFVTRATGRRIQARYTISAFPTICNPGGTLPDECSPVNSGVICTVNGNTYYQGTSCVVPYYLQ